MEKEKVTVDAYFARERDAFISLAAQATRTSHLIGVRTVDVRRVRASWLFIRACLTAKSIETVTNTSSVGIRRHIVPRSLFNRIVDTRFDRERRCIALSV